MKQDAVFNHAPRQVFTGVITVRGITGKRRDHFFIQLHRDLFAGHVDRELAISAPKRTQ